MKVVLFEIPVIGFEIRSFGVMAMLAFLAGFLTVIYRVSSRSSEDINYDFYMDLSIVCLITGLIGARIFYVIQEGYTFELFSIPQFFSGNFNTIGILIGLITAIFLYVFTRSQYVQKQTGWFTQIKRDVRQPRMVLFLLALCLIGGFVGGRTLFVLKQTGKNSQALGQSPFDIFKVWKGGLVFYGGFFLAFISGILYIKHWGYSVLEKGDLFAPAFLLAQSTSRWGCFLVGDDFGTRVAASHPFAVQFPMHPIEKSSQFICTQRDIWTKWVARQADIYVYQMQKGLINSCQEVVEEGVSLSSHTLTVHPAQIYMSGGVFLCFLLLLGLEKWQPWKGWSLGWMVVLYSIHRFIVEFWRGDPVPVYDWSPIVTFAKLLHLPQVHAGGVVQYGLRISQLISVFLLPVGLLILFFGWYFSPKH